MDPGKQAYFDPVTGYLGFTRQFCLGQKPVWPKVIILRYYFHQVGETEVKVTSITTQ